MHENFIESIAKNEISLFHFFDLADFSEDFHCHDSYEIYINISGGKNFFINDKIYDNMPHDLFIHNNYEIHKTTMGGINPYDRYVLEFRPEAVLPYCTKKTNLAHIFTYRPNNFSHRVSLSDEQFDYLMKLIKKCEQNDDYFGKDVLNKLRFIEILVYVSEIFQISQKESSNLGEDYKAAISPILEFVSKNLSEDLCLDNIANHVNLNKYYMCRLFKTCTGTTINKFIVRRRIAKAKELLNQGHSLIQVCDETGFNDYCHFIRTFREFVGVSPIKYANGITAE
ncbi:MAG: AraC family transcriptional regulator [Clostridiales bacterium]|nr:AraC family transcriptional regulator [Clostridiales bacterium]